MANSIAVSTTPSEIATRYLGSYPAALRGQVQDMIASGSLGPNLLKHYGPAHAVRNEAALYDYVQELKRQYQRSTPPLSRICYDNQIHVVRNALGTHSRVSRVQGKGLTSKREIRIASLFRSMPEAFLRMIVVHELAHLRQAQHDKAFYNLCCHMEPDYHQIEFDLRAYLCWLEAGGPAMWA